MPTKRSRVVCLLLCSVGLSSHSSAQPSVRVAAGSNLELEAVRATQSVRIRGALTDDQGRGIEDAIVWIRIERPSGGPILERSAARTSAEGFAELKIVSAEPAMRIHARFAGDDYHPSAERDMTFEVDRAAVSLRFVAPPSGLLDLDQAEHTVSVRASSEAGASGLGLMLEDEHGRELARGSTDATGTLSFELASLSLGDPGVGKLIARAPSDALRSEGRVEIAVLRFRATQLSLAVVSQGRTRARVAGSLRANGIGVAHATVGIFDGRGEHVATIETNGKGELRHDIELTSLLGADDEAEAASVRARYFSEAPWLGSSESAPVPITVDASRTSDLFWLFGTPLTLAMILAWLRNRRRNADVIAPRDARTDAGVALSRTRHATLGAAAEHAVVVLILDATRGTPIANAVLHIDDPSSTDARAQTRAEANASGEIRIAAVARGSHRARFEAPGYRALEASLRAPHRGEWINAVVRLENLRDTALNAWSPVALRVWHSEERARATTVRETLQRADAVAALARTELVAYGRGTPTEPQVQSIESDAASEVSKHASDTAAAPSTNEDFAPDRHP